MKLDMVYTYIVSTDVRSIVNVRVIQRVQLRK